MKTFAFIFARGGSKGLPKKNVLLLNKKPLIGHSIDLANDIEEISKIYVSTEDREIAKIARTFGAEVISRPQELAGDESPELLSWKHAINFLKDKGLIFDRFISLPATSPLRNSSDIKNCMNCLSNGTDMVVTVTESQRSPYFNMVKMDKDNIISLLVSDGKKYSRRQEPPKVYDLTTVAYVARPEFILSSEDIFKGKIKGVIIPRERAIDIDSEIDLLVAETIFRLNKDKDA